MGRDELEPVRSLIPDIETTTRIFSHAAAPAFLLFAIISLCSIYSVRLTGQTAILRALVGDQKTDARLLSERIDIAEKRCLLLSSGLRFSCYAAFGTLLLILILVVAGAFAARHVYGVPLVFIGVLTCLFLSVVQLTREVRLEMLEIRLHRGASAGAPGRGTGP